MYKQKKHTTTLVKMIEAVVNPSDIINVVIGDKNKLKNDEIPKGKLLTWKEAKKYLNYEFTNKYGGEDCNALYVWTSNLVIIVLEYDGSYNIKKIPRNPIDIYPTF